jgi:hypothetical protein
MTMRLLIFFENKIKPFYLGEGIHDLIEEDIKLGKDKMSKIIKPDSIFKNEQNQPIYFRLNGDSVYSFYDEFGWKIKDSIPRNFLSGMHEINYRYTKMKVIRTENFQSPNLTIKTTFRLDSHGNCTK